MITILTYWFWMCYFWSIGFKILQFLYKLSFNTI